jgi:rSAM/selenodomain-associated transferase 1
MSLTRVIVFAKAPQPGAAKTRLIPALGADAAARLAERMLAATLRTAIDAQLGPVELCMAPDPGTPEWSTVPLPVEIELSAQGAGDLGARLARAARRAIERGETVLLIGTDCVEMSAEILREAASAVAQVGAVIHCTADGGYALLGLTRFDALLFKEMPWSTAVVAAETLRRFERLGWPVRIGQTLHDVDSPADLALLPPEFR